MKNILSTGNQSPDKFECPKETVRRMIIRYCRRMKEYKVDNPTKRQSLNDLPHKQLKMKYRYLKKSMHLPRLPQSPLFIRIKSL